MLTQALFTLLYPVPASNNLITISSTGDTLLNLTNAPIDDLPSTSTFTFLVCSQTLRNSSSYFASYFRPIWCEPTRADGKYHISLSGHKYDAMAVYIVLLTLHQPFSARVDDGLRHADIGLPDTVSLNALLDVLSMIDYFQLPFASDLVAGNSAPWFEQFLGEDGEWDLPNGYGEEIMMFWWLARCFEPAMYSRSGLSLPVAVEQVVFRHRGKMLDFGWPIHQAELDDLEIRRNWFGGGATLQV